MNAGTRMSPARSRATIRMVRLALGAGVVVLCLVGVAGAVGRGIFPTDLVTRAEPVRLRLLELLDRTGWSQPAPWRA